MATHTRIVRRAPARLCWLAALALALAGLTLPPSPARAAAVFTVDVAGDVAPAAANGSCYNASAGGCTLREAIQEAAAAGSATVDFAAGLAGATITLANSLGGLRVNADAITIDGTTRGITVSGASLAASQSVFVLQGNGVQLRNLGIRDAPQDGVAVGDFDFGTGIANNVTVYGLRITGSGRAGVYVSGGSGGGNGATIRENLIGASPLGSACILSQGNTYGILISPGVVGTQVVLNTVVCNSIDGISINGAGSAASSTRTNIQQNYLGTSGVAALGNGYAGIAIYGGAQRIDLFSNLIAGNLRQGVYIAGATTNDIAIFGTRIGLNQTGTAAIPNEWQGIAVEGLTNANVTIYAGNTISGNGLSGILLHNSSHVTVKGNQIGTNPSGTAAIGNGTYGVEIDGSSTFNTISGDNASERNVISGNLLDGVAISGGGATDNTVDNNLIGLSASGAAAIPNGRHGAAIYSASNNYVGTSAPRSQFISGNLGAGIYVENASGTFIGQTNAIGVAGDGATPRGNQQEGVLLKNTTSTSVFASVIAYSGGAGVALSGSGSTTGNAILPSAVHNNGGLPIDLGADGPTRNILDPMNCTARSA